MNVSVSQDGGPAAGQEARQQAEAPQALLYQRYLSALLLLCECAPYVDEADYLVRLDALLEEACAHYPLQWQAHGPYRELAPRPC